MRRAVPLIALVLLCVIGLITSTVLVIKHFDRRFGTSWVDAGCAPVGEDSVSDCDALHDSAWGKVRGQPTGYWGMAYFLTLGLWFVFVGRPTADRRHWHVVPLLMSLAGAGGSAVFLYVMYVKFQRHCSWCLTTHLTNFAILATTWWVRPRRLVPAPAGPIAMPHAVPLRATRPHPSFRLAIVTLALGGLGALALWEAMLVVNKAMTAETLKSVLAVTYQLCKPEDKRTITERGDDAVREAADLPLQIQVMVFSDFSCPSCRRFAEALDKHFGPMFDGGLRVVFKHYPLSCDCNPAVRANIHRSACATARAAEAARRQGGNEAFWRAHDLLFQVNGQNQLAALDYRALASRLGLDPDRFDEDMHSAETLARIREDAELGRSLGVRTTPTVFVNGQRIPFAVAGQADFWRSAAHIYKARLQLELNAPVAGSAALEPTAATAPPAPSGT